MQKRVGEATVPYGTVSWYYLLAEAVHTFLNQENNLINGLDYIH